jgi:hypothetical protein
MRDIILKLKKEICYVKIFNQMVYQCCCVVSGCEHFFWGSFRKLRDNTRDGVDFGFVEYVSQANPYVALNTFCYSYAGFIYAYNKRGDFLCCGEIGAWLLCRRFRQRALGVNTLQFNQLWN